MRRAATSTGRQSSVQSRSGAAPMRTQPLTTRARMSSRVEGAGLAVAGDERRTVDRDRQPASPGFAHERFGDDLGLRIAEMQAREVGSAS